MFGSQIPDYLAPGYYIFKVEFGKGAGSAITFEGDGNARGCTAIKLERAGTLLVRLRKPTRIGLSAGLSASEPPSLKYLKLWAPLATLIKSLKPYRMRHRIPMVNSAGYICVLNGISARDKLPILSQNAILRTLALALGPGRFIHTVPSFIRSSPRVACQARKFADLRSERQNWRLFAPLLFRTLARVRSLSEPNSTPVRPMDNALRVEYSGLQTNS